MPTFYRTLDPTFEEKRTSAPASLRGLAQGVHCLRGVPRRRPAALHPQERRSVLIDCIPKDLGFEADIAGGEARSHASCRHFERHARLRDCRAPLPPEPVVGASFGLYLGRGLPAISSGFWQHCGRGNSQCRPQTANLSSPPNKYAGQREKFLPDGNRRDSRGSDQLRFVPGSLTVKGRIL